MELKSVQNGVQSGFGRALIENSDSKLKKERSFIAAPVGEHKLEDFGAPEGRETGRGKWLHTPDVPWTSQGVGGQMQSNHI